jgi:hypothetical protein
MLSRVRLAAALLPLAVTACSRLPHVSPSNQPQTNSSSDASSTPRYSGGDGSSCDRPVIINVHGWVEGIAAEYQYLKEKFPDGRPGSQALAEGQDGRRYDVIEWIRADRTPVRVCFDINQFIGNYNSLQ